MSILKIENLTFAYERDIILDDVNLEIEKGDFAALIGRNGSGKSTLIKLILKELEPDSGRIYTTGIETADIGYVPQLQIGTTREFPITVGELVSLAFYDMLRGFKKVSPEIKDSILYALSQVGMEEEYETLYSKLSGGQRQRVIIAKALVKNTKFLILDEPTRGVDVKTKAEIYSLINELAKKGLAIIMVSSELPELINMSDRIVAFSSGYTTGELSRNEFSQERIMTMATER